MWGGKEQEGLHTEQRGTQWLIFTFFKSLHNRLRVSLRHLQIGVTYKRLVEMLPVPI